MLGFEKSVKMGWISLSLVIVTLVHSIQAQTGYNYPSPQIPFGVSTVTGVTSTTQSPGYSVTTPTPQVIFQTNSGYSTTTVPSVAGGYPPAGVTPSPQFPPSSTFTGYSYPTVSIGPSSFSTTGVPSTTFLPISSTTGVPISSTTGDLTVRRGESHPDYPVLSYVPATSFSCAQKYPGYYADVETGCQTFHYCTNGLTYHFLCPNGTIFNQIISVCMWWYQFDCSTAPSYYYLNKQRYDSINVMEESEKMDVSVGGVVSTVGQPGFSLYGLPIRNTASTRPSTVVIGTSPSISTVTGTYPGVSVSSTRLPASISTVGYPSVYQGSVYLAPNAVSGPDYSSTPSTTIAPSTTSYPSSISYPSSTPVPYYSSTVSPSTFSTTTIRPSTFPSTSPTVSTVASGYSYSTPSPTFGYSSNIVSTTPSTISTTTGYPSTATIYQSLPGSGPTQFLQPRPFIQFTGSPGFTGQSYLAPINRPSSTGTPTSLYGAPNYYTSSVGPSTSISTTYPTPVRDYLPPLGKKK